MFGHGFDRTKYTLHSAKYTVQLTQYTVHSTLYKLHSTQYRASGIPVFTRCAIQEMRSSGDVEFTRRGVRRWGVHEIGSSGDGELRRWGVEEIESSRDGKLRRWRVQPKGTSIMRWEFLHIVSSGVKLQGSNRGSLLRSKSTRHERRCELGSV